METSAPYIKQGWVWAFALFIFFFNTFPLPQGLTYTLLLTPVWIYFLYRQHKLSAGLALLVPLGIYAILHFGFGVILSYYIVSSLMLAAVLLFSVAAYQFINHPGISWDLIFRDIVILNFILVLCSIPCLYIDSLKPLVWYLVPLTKDVELPRLKMFTYEASHYSFALSALFVYFYSRFFFFKTQRPFLTLLMVTVPLILSFSLGVLSCLAISLILLLVIYGKRIFASATNRKVIGTGIFISVILLIAAYYFYPDNPLFIRIRNIFNGDDTSARGRTYEAFILAHKIIEQKSYLWGIGPGQLKVLGRNIIVQYYLYSNIPQVVRIPNACAETIIYFGYIGLAIRLIIQVFLFFKTKVASNPFRLWLFLFLFIYQFTGSYITNMMEYFMWLLAFSPIFPEFIEKRLYNKPIANK